MAGSLLGLELRQLVLDENISSGTLETRLTSAVGNLGAFRALMGIRSSVKMFLGSSPSLTIMAGSNKAMEVIAQSPEAMEVFAANDNATEIFSNNAKSAKQITNNIISFNAYFSISTNYARLQARVNASGSKLKRQIFNSTSTFSFGALESLCVMCIGGGGTGGNADTGGADAGGAGGSGGEFAFINLISSYLVHLRTSHSNIL